MLRVVVAVMLGAIGVGVSAATVAVAEQQVDIAASVVAARSQAPTLGVTVLGERQVGATVVTSAYGEGIVHADGEVGRWTLRVEDGGVGGDADVLVDGDRWTVRSSLLDGVLAPGTHATVDASREPTTPEAALALGLLGDLPVGLDLLDLAEATEGGWLRDTDELLADGTTAEGWRRQLSGDELLEVLSPAQAARWRLQLLAVTPDDPRLDADLTPMQRVVAAAEHHVEDPPGEVHLRVHVHEGALRRVELAVRGDGGNTYLQRRQVVEVRDAGRQVPRLEPGARVRDLTDSTDA